MPSSADPSAAVLAVLAPWLAQLGPVICAELTVTLPDGQRRTLSASISALLPAPRPALLPAPVPVAVPAAPAPVPAAHAADLTDKEARLLAVASGEPIPRKLLILHARLRYNSHSRALVKGLIERGRLVAEGRGVRAAVAP